jgi:hypothetical protein
MARMMETQDVREGDVVSFARYGYEFVVRERRQVAAAVVFEVEDLGGDVVSMISVPNDQGVIVRLRDGRPFGDEDVLTARTMRWS